MRKKIQAILGILFILALTMARAATNQDITVTFVIPSAMSISVAYGGSCDSTNFYFVENDATKDGVAVNVNATSDSAGSSSCQDADESAMNITNNGNEAANITIFTPYSAISDLNITLYIGDTDAATIDPCSDTELISSSCVNFSTSMIVLIENLAVSGEDQFWLKARFGKDGTAANVGSGLGVAGSNATKIRFNMTEYA